MTDAKFVEYYEEQSLQDSTLRRFRGQMQRIEQILGSRRRKSEDTCLRVLDLGCGAGASSSLWREAGHTVVGLDILEDLISTAAKRARAQQQPADYVVGSAECLPFDDGWADVCLAPELLEHVPNWQGCLDEIFRVLKPGSVVFISTTNTLCPIQQEFNLPLFSWYPGPVKRKVFELTRTRRPDLANYAPYPAVNWFNVYSLGRALRDRGFSAVWTTFDLPQADWPRTKRMVAMAAAQNQIVRYFLQTVTPGTQVYAQKALE